MYDLGDGADDIHHILIPSSSKRIPWSLKWWSSCPINSSEMISSMSTKKRLQSLRTSGMVMVSSIVELSFQMTRTPPRPRLIEVLAVVVMWRWVFIGCWSFWLRTRLTPEFSSSANCFQRKKRSRNNLSLLSRLLLVLLLLWRRGWGICPHP